MLFFLFFFGLALGDPSPSDVPQVKLQRGSCPMFWYSFNGRCYKYVATDMTWADAELHCLSQGANLVSIHSVGEQHFVNSLISNFDPAQGKTWFGLSDIHKDSAWMWSDGCPVNFIFWHSSQPNGEDTDHCAQTNFAGPEWFDRPCHETFPFVCASRITCP